MLNAEQSPVTGAALPVQYRFRANGFEKEKTYVLEPDALVISGDDVPQRRIDYIDIVRIQLTFSPTRWQRNRYQATIHPKKGRRIRLASSSYKGFGDFIAQDDDYRKFVIKLRFRVFRANPAFELLGGISPMQYLGYWALCCFIAVGFLVIAFMLFKVGMSALILVKLVIIALYIPTLARFMKRAKPVRRLPLRIPRDYLPWPETLSSKP